MDILVVAPMEMERDNFLQAVSNYYGGCRNYYRTLVCGVGKISAAMNVQNFLATNADMRVDMIALIGYAGGGSESVPGAVVMPDVCYQWDVDVPYSPWFNRMVEPHMLRGSDRVSILTGDTFVNRGWGRCLEKTYGKNVIYDMECAAVASVAENENIPMVAIKIISDVPYRPWWKRKAESFDSFISKNTDFLSILELLEEW